MRVIHSGILAVILSIFLIQAADPPYEKSTGSFLSHQFDQLISATKLPLFNINSPLNDDVSKRTRLQHLPETSSLNENTEAPRINSTTTPISLIMKDNNAEDVENQKEFLEPLLRLYENDLHNNLDSLNITERISKEDEKVEELKYLTKEELDFLMNPYNTNDPLYNRNKPYNEEVTNNVARRVDDGTLPSSISPDKEHIGEILPSNFNNFPSPSQRSLKNVLSFHPVRRTIPIIVRRRMYITKPYHSNRILKKSFDSQHYYRPFSFPYEDPSKFRRPMKFLEDVANVRSEYDYSFIPTAGFTDDAPHKTSNSKPDIVPDGTRTGYARPSAVSVIQNRYRNVRTQKGLIVRDPATDSSNWQGNSWKVSRRPRVIFPSDLVAFKETNQEEPDWLGADANLQDIQQNDIKDRGSEDDCTEDATCEFFLTCWMSGGLLDGTCGLLRGCCQRDNSKSGRSTSQMVGTIEAPRETAKAQAALFDLDTQCGIPSRQQAQRRIVGGDEPGFGSFPWQAYIRIGSSRCGGSLVSRRHVVTAGHCVARAIPKQVHVTLGDYVINSAAEPLPAYTFGVSSIQVHPFFKFTPQADRFDVAVLRLDRTANHLPHIAPICLPTKGENFLGEVGVAAGWGALSPGSRLRPQTLQAVPVPVIDNRQCERWHRSKGIGVTIYDEMMCAGYKNGGRDSCQGDSGGPLMLQKQGRWFLIGIVSAGYSCAQPGQPGIYHRVAHTVDWIARAIAA
ncbi:uncharacterized protein LOC108740895 isoform X1 [Agrilus planipennis]|uniref:Uncharacterized protein LOC108740895 isoform X1 n=1 Tax=Agrilus planipennis TaxID=224129 RepID=A0A1W4XEZ0_AGRPL|nr:uncharacterized protein LOC108740895 isoform X1 [Agrilus planipennis]